MPKAPFSVETAEDSLGFLLWQATAIWQRKIQTALEAHRVPHTQFVLLASLLWFEALKQEVTQVLMVRHTKLDKMTVSQTLKKLEQQGLAKRAAHKTDTRAKQVTLTAKGRVLARQLVPVVERVDAEFFRRLAPEKQKSLTACLYRLTQAERPTEEI